MVTERGSRPQTWKLEQKLRACVPNQTQEAERVNWKRVEHLNSQNPPSSSMITTSSKATPPKPSSSSTHWSPSLEFV